MHYPITPQRTEIVFVFDDLADWQQLASAGREAGHEVVVLDGSQDGLVQMANFLQGRSGVDVLRAIARHYRQDLQRPGFARLLVTGETRPDRIGEIAASRIPVLFKPISPQKLREAMLAAVFAARALPSEHSSSNP